MVYYIGLDAHSRTCTGVVVDEKGEIKLRQTFPTSEEGLQGFMARVPGEKHLTFEECHLAQWLYVTLKDQVDKLVVCNPVYLAKKPGAKTDFRDALHLAQELRTGHLKPVYHDESKWIELRVLVNNYLALVEEIVRAKNRLKAVFRSEAIDTNTTHFYTTKDRTKELSHENARFVAENLYDQIAALEKLKEGYRERFKKNIKTYRPIKNLTSVPGIDTVRANVAAAVICMPHRFKNKHQFWGYCMLVRHIQMSGGRIYGNKRFHGRAELRDIFIGAAESALRTDTKLREYYDCLRAKGVDHKDARIALARKIAALVLSLLKNSETYREDFEQEDERRKTLRKQLYQELISKTS
ncbi:MAG: IS110 family transposase [Leptolyngbyaceae cyanobacterium bins.302]|nr:IS110 family transposase [Leptolyngbyaceae cyanobacterium bins.302]